MDTFLTMGDADLQELGASLLLAYIALSFPLPPPFSASSNSDIALIVYSVVCPSCLLFLRPLNVVLWIAPHSLCFRHCTASIPKRNSRPHSGALRAPRTGTCLTMRFFSFLLVFPPSFLLFLFTFVASFPPLFPLCSSFFMLFLIISFSIVHISPLSLSLRDCSSL